MKESKAPVVSAITRAQAALEEALDTLDNLVSNAVKYSQPAKQVWVEVRNESSWAVCSVKDEGPGLSQEDQLKLFHRGERRTPKPTGGEASSGYGLAVAQELVEKMDGEIRCESTLGQGSWFSFRLPSYREDVPGTETA